MELKQQLRLTQQLVMTPQLQQAIRLLQLSRLELIDEVRKELDGNPILSAEEEPDPKTRASDDSSRSIGAVTASGSTESVENNFSPNDHQKVEAEKATREVDWEKFLENRTQQQAPSLGPRNSDDLPPFEQNLTKPSSLAEHLRWQLQMSDFTD